jgi:hypothetical protein
MGNAELPGETAILDETNPGEVVKSPARLERVSGLYLSGLTQREIGAKLGVSAATVNRDIGELLAGWRRDAATMDLGQLRGAEVARMLRVISLATAGFQRSLNDRERTTTRTSRKHGTTTETLREGQSGNPSYLRVIKEASERIAKLTGLDVPLKLEHAGPDGGPIPLVALLARACEIPSPEPATTHANVIDAATMPLPPPPADDELRDHE